MVCQDNIADYFSVKSCSWAVVNIAQVYFLCNVGPGKSRQHCIGHFPAKTCLCALDQHCTSYFLVQCYLISIWTTLTGQYSYAMLSQQGRYNIVQVIFLIKVVCQQWANISQVISLCNVGPDRFRQHCTRKKTFFNVVF